MLAWQKIYGFAEIAESFLTWNEGDKDCPVCHDGEHLAFGNNK